MIVEASVEVVDYVTRLVKAEVSHSFFLESIEEISARYRAPIKLSHYRPLSVPSRILQEVLEALITRTLEEIAEREGFRLCARRCVDLEPLKEGGNILFTATISVFPKPYITNYKNIPLTIKTPNITNDELLEAVKLLFYADHGPMEGAEDKSELKKLIKGHMFDRKLIEELARAQSEVIDRILAENHFEVPREAVEREVDQIRALESDRFLAPDEIHREALKRVRMRIMLDQVAHQEGIEAKDLDSVRLRSLDYILGIDCSMALAGTGR